MNKPKTLWTNITEWFDKGKHLASLAAIMTGLFFFYHQFTRDTLKSDADLLKITGVVTDYSFAEKQGHRGTLHQYYIWLDGYKSTFQIKADFLDYFQKDEFERRISKGDSISLTIPKQKETDLNNAEENIFVVSIDRHKLNFLNKTKTLENENSNFDIYVGTAFLIFGVGYYLLKRR